MRLLVSVPNSMSYRYYGEDEFILGAEAFRRDTQTDAVLYYACDAEDAQEPVIEEFLQHYTQEENPLCDYESKATYVAEFESFRSMFSLLGGVLSAVVGLVGVLRKIPCATTKARPPMLPNLRASAPCSPCWAACSAPWWGWWAC